MTTFVINPYIHATAGGGSFTTDAAEFDGTNDYQRFASTMSVAASKTGICSAWVYNDSSIATFERIFYLEGGSQTLTFYVTSNEAVNVFGSNSNLAGTELNLGSNNAVFTYNAWHHILASWDLSTGTTHLYMDGVDVKSFGGTANNNIDYSAMTSWTVGADNGGNTKWNGGLAEVYFAPGQFLDFSVQANREKFRTAAGKPENLGVDGSTPTGTAPLIYCHIDDGEAAANFATNRGSGDDFTVTGALTTYASSPSD